MTARGLALSVTLLCGAVVIHRVALGSQGGSVAIQKVLELSGADAWRVLDSPNGRFYFIEDRDSGGMIRVVNAAGAPIAAIPGSSGYLAIAPDFTRAVFLRSSRPPSDTRWERDVHVWSVALDSATGAIRGSPRRLSVRPGEYPAFSPDGAMVSYSRKDSAGYGLYVIPANGGAERRVVHRPGRIVSHMWSPDGTWIYYAHWPAGAEARIERVPTRGGGPDSVLPGGGFLIGFSRDGRLFARARSMGRGDAFDEEVSIHRADGVRISVINPPGGRATWSASHPDRLVSAVVESAERLRRLSYPGGDVFDLPRATNRDLAPDWTPDGRLLFLGDVGGRLQYFVAERDGGNRRLLRTRAQPTVRGHMSPDGRRYAFRSEPPGLGVIDLSSGIEHHIPVPGLDAFRWRSDGRAILYVRSESPSKPSIRQVRAWSPAVRDTLVRDIGAFGAGGPVEVVDDTLLLAAGQTGVFALSLRSGATRQVAEGWVFSVGARTASPDGRWIAFRRWDSATDAYQIHLLDRASGRSHSVGRPFTCSAGVAGWHPNGRELFLIGRDGCAGGRRQLYVAAIEGGAARNLMAGETGEVGTLVLHPDGTQLVYVVTRAVRAVVHFTQLQVAGSP